MAWWIGLALASGIAAWFLAQSRRRRREPPASPPSRPIPSGGHHPESLEGLLAAGFRAAERRPAFYRALLDSELLVLPVDPPAGRGPRLLEIPSPFRLRSWEKDGRPVVAVYTSPARIAETLGPDTPYLEVPGRRLLQAIGRDASVVLNPGCAYTKEFDPEEIAVLLDGSLLRRAAEVTLPQGTRFRVSSPSSVPAELVAKLSGLFRANPGVRAAHLVTIRFDGEPPHFLVGVEIDADRLPAAARVTLVQEAGYLVRSASSGPPQVWDLKLLEDDETDRLIRKVRPFYKA